MNNNRIELKIINIDILAVPSLSKFNSAIKNLNRKCIPFFSINSQLNLWHIICFEFKKTFYLLIILLILSGDSYLLKNNYLVGRNCKELLSKYAVNMEKLLNIKTE